MFRGSRLPWFVVIGYLPLIVCLTASGLSWFSITLDVFIVLGCVLFAVCYGAGQWIYTIDEHGTGWSKSVRFVSINRHVRLIGIVIAYCAVCVVLALQSPINVSTKDGRYYALEQGINPATSKLEKYDVEITKAQYDEAKPREYRAGIAVLSIFALIFGIAADYSSEIRRRFAQKSGGSAPTAGYRGDDGRHVRSADLNEHEHRADDHLARADKQ